MSIIFYLILDQSMPADIVSQGDVTSRRRRDVVSMDGSLSQISLSSHPNLGDHPWTPPVREVRSTGGPKGALARLFIRILVSRRDFYSEVLNTHTL
mgnify:CR=1 FL=1